MGHSLESERCYVPVSAKVCRKLWENAKFAPWTIASMARLHEVRSKVLYCCCREGQPCQGDEIVRAFAQTKSVEESRGGALPRLEGLSLCEVGWVLKSHLCLSPRDGGLAMQEMLKRCSTLSREEGVRDLLPFPLSPFPTTAEMDLSMTSTHGELVSPELIHEAAVDVWMFLLK